MDAGWGFFWSDETSKIGCSDGYNLNILNHWIVYLKGTRELYVCFFFLFCFVGVF